MPVTYFLGLDLGQRRDPAALALVERAEVLLELDRVTYERRRALRFRVSFLERVRLGTPYPNVVDRAPEVADAGGPLHGGDGCDRGRRAGAGHAAES